MKGFKRFSILSLLLLVALVSTSCSDKKGGNSSNNLANQESNNSTVNGTDKKGGTSSNDLINQEGVIATVNGTAITQDEYDKALLAFKQQVESEQGVGAWDKEVSEGKTLGKYYEENIILDNLILQRLLYEAAEKEGITMSDEELGAEIDVYKSYFDDDAGYQEFLKANNMTEEYFKQAIKEEYLIKHYIDEKIETYVPTDEELQKLFDEQKISPQVRASHILVKTEEEAKAVLERINKGEAFETVAKEVSLDTSNKDKGGDLDYFNYTKMVKEFSDAAFSMNVGDLSQPVKTDFGYHIIKVTDKKTVTLESVKDSLTETFKTKKYQEMLDNLKANAEIVEK